MSPKGAEPWESRCQQIQRSVIFTGAHSKDVWSLDSQKNSLHQHVGYCRRNYCIWQLIWDPNSLDIELWGIILAWPLYQGHPCGTLRNKLPHSLPKALILQALTPRVSLPPPLQDVQDNQIRSPKGRTTWTRAKFTWLHWDGTIRVKYHFVWRASHRNQTRNTKGMLNIQIYSNFPLITIHIFAYFNILVCTEGMCMYIYSSGDDNVPSFPLKLLADLELSSPLATLPERIFLLLLVDFGARA